MSETRVVHVNDHVPGAVYIGRAVPRRKLAASPLANPYRIGPDMTRAQAIGHYRASLLTRIANERMPSTDRLALVWVLIGLRGKPLACWCRHDGEPRTDANACHGDVLVELLERYTDEELRATGGRG